MHIFNEQIILLNYEIGRRMLILVRLDDPLYKKKKDNMHISPIANSLNN